MENEWLRWLNIAASIILICSAFLYLAMIVMVFHLLRAAREVTAALRQAAELQARSMTPDVGQEAGVPKPAPRSYSWRPDPPS